MFGDFSRDSYDPGKHYTRVLMQQGRPLIDADWNEQITSLIEAQRQLAIAVIGWHGTPDGGFQIASGTGDQDYTLSAGSYFVDGIQCRNERVTIEKPNRPFNLPTDSNISADQWLYLDVWEQAICPSQDSAILEPALGRIDTAWRSQVQWTVRYSNAPIGVGNDYQKFMATVRGRDQDKDVTLAVRPASSSGTSTKGACEIDSGASSQVDRLYRIEIHKAGKAASGAMTGDKLKDVATFKWSRENGSVVASVVSTRDAAEKILPPSGPTLTRDALRFSSSIPIAKQRWCELIDQEGRSANEQRQLVQIERIEGDRIQVSPPVNVNYEPGRALVAPFELKASTKYFLRQWDHAGTALTTNETVVSRLSDSPESNSQTPLPQLLKKPILSNGCLVVVTDCWIQLENGISIKFTGTDFLEGDYWLMRVSRNNGVTLLPGPNPQAPAAARTIHHYAPIGSIKQASDNSNKLVIDPLPYWNQIKKAGLDYYEKDWPNNSPPFGLPSPAPMPPMGHSTPMPTAPSPVITPASVLSGEGQRALTGYFESPQSLTRRVPARYLNHESSSAAYSHFRSALLVSEILEDSFEKYFAKVERCLSLKESDRAIVEKDARADYALAVEFERMLLSGETSRPRIA
ncbi:MAG TPA: DUF6519 domain-containing protein [Schlesneria sp.]|jgi:hypothetical protein